MQQMGGSRLAGSEGISLVRPCRPPSIRSVGTAWPASSILGPTDGFKRAVWGWTLRRRGGGGCGIFTSRAISKQLDMVYHSDEGRLSVSL